MEAHLCIKGQKQYPWPPPARCKHHTAAPPPPWCQQSKCLQTVPNIPWGWKHHQWLRLSVTEEHSQSLVLIGDMKKDDYWVSTVDFPVFLPKQCCHARNKFYLLFELGYWLPVFCSEWWYVLHKQKSLQFYEVEYSNARRCPTGFSAVNSQDWKPGEANKFQDDILKDTL